MAKILFINGDQRGTVGGVVYSKNKYGSYVKQKVSPVQPNTDAQKAIKGIFSTISRSWNGLTDTQKQAWNDFAAHNPITDAFGLTKVLSGNAMFGAIGFKILQAFPEILTDAPTGQQPPAARLLSTAFAAPSTVQIFVENPSGVFGVGAVGDPVPNFIFQTSFAISNSNAESKLKAAIRQLAYITATYTADPTKISLVGTVPTVLSNGLNILLTVQTIDITTANKGNLSPGTKIISVVSGI